jgi:hypothetical protein
MGTARYEARDQSSAWPLENHDVSGRLAHDRVDAPWLLDGPIDGESGQSRQPQEKGHSSSYPVGLPKYSPDLNPIEQVFSKLKHLLRKDAARTLEAVCACIGKLLGAFTPQECANYFKNAGYNLT